jgi:hypothetical protein
MQAQQLCSHLWGWVSSRLLLGRVSTGILVPLRAGNTSHSGISENRNASLRCCDQLLALSCGICAAAVAVDGAVPTSSPPSSSAARPWFIWVLHEVWDASA